MKIKDILAKHYKTETSYQRGDKVWNIKIKNGLIDSILKGYYVPAIIVANGEIIDGKQRVTTLIEFNNNEFKYKDENSDKFSNGTFLKDFENEDNEIFQNFNIYVKDLGELTPERIKETFIRINESSIKLNKAEMELAKTTLSNRNLVLNIARNPLIQKIANYKKNDKRFQIENLIMRCITILKIPNDKTSVRNYQQVLFRNEIMDDKVNLEKKFNNVINCMWSILYNDSIPIRRFNTIFESIFIALYRQIKSLNSFIWHRQDIKAKILESIDEITKNQMGGAKTFDSMTYINERIKKIEDILEPFLVDNRRLFSYDEKLKLWNTHEHKCAICNENINDINDYEPDHIIAHTLGGETTMNNVRILCRKCNRKEGVKARDDKKSSNN